MIIGSTARKMRTKLTGTKKTQNRFIVVWPHGRYFLSFLATYLFSTFPEPPLTFEASPFSTARKFSGVTSCNNRHINPQSLLSAEKPLQTIVWKILKSVDLLQKFTEALTSPMQSLGTPLYTSLPFGLLITIPGVGFLEEKHDSDTQKEVQIADTTLCEIKGKQMDNNDSLIW